MRRSCRQPSHFFTEVAARIHYAAMSRAVPDESGGQARIAAPATALSCAELYREHFRFLWRNARRLGAPVHACDDVVQEVFVVAQRRLGEFRGDASIATWLYAILANVVREQRRKDRLRETKTTLAGEAMEVVRPPAATPADVLARKQATELLEGILAAMDEDKREMFVLVEIEQISATEAAQALGINLNTAYARLRAARTLFSESVQRAQLRAKTESSASGRREP